GEHIGWSALVDLGGQCRAAGEVELHRAAGVGRLEVLADPGERLGQRRRREHVDGSGDPGAAGTRRGRAGGLRPAAAADQTQHRQRRQAVLPARSHTGVLPLLPTVRAERSTTTVVDLITATATEPTRRSRSSTASRLISDTTRNGPAWMSTCAITVSLTTAVTMPRSRLRADDPSERSSASPAWEPANAARSTPSITRCPCSSRTAVTPPASTPRRTVSALTPTSSATPPIATPATGPP